MWYGFVYTTYVVVRTWDWKTFSQQREDIHRFSRSWYGVEGTDDEWHVSMSLWLSFFSYAVVAFF